MLQGLSISQIVDLTGGKLLCGENEFVVTNVAIDSRQVVRATETLFVALQGAKASGELFIPDLISLGVKAFLVSKSFDENKIRKDEGLIFIAVPDTREALQKIAAFQRKQFKKPLLGITGSNGKTIVKEWLGQVLSEEYTVGKSPKSYNSQVGVPLSIFGLSAYHQVAILEAGISKPGEMDALENMIQPHLGIFTNIGSAHDEGFPSRKAKIWEKLKLFKRSKFVIYQKNDSELSNSIEQEFSADRLISWGDEPGATFVRSVKKLEQGTRIVLLKEDLEMLTFKVPFSDSASLENITHVLVAALTLGEQSTKIQQALDHLKPVEMRLTLKDGANESLLIDDTYSNDLAGLRVALDFMKLQRPKKRRVVILSDVLQHGAVEEVYSEISGLLSEYEIDQVYAVGKEVHRISSAGSMEIALFETTQDLLQGISPNDFQEDLILITGARVFGFERVVNFLQRRIHGTTLEINLNALTHNFNFYKKQLKPQTKVMVMVKAFAYGGGAAEIANHLQSMGADYLAVAFTDEGVALREEGITLPIMVLNPVKESLLLCQQYDLEPVVFSPSFLRFTAALTQKEKIELSIHLDFDTGMHRLGFDESELADLGEILLANPQLELKSIYTHLAGADEEVHKEYSIQQLETFARIKEKLKLMLSIAPLAHALNSAGILAFPSFQFDMVRLGIGLYGVEVTGKNEGALKPISTLKTTISQIKEIPPGGTIGYSRKGVLPDGGRIATLAIGYADGYDRRFSNGGGFVLIHGQKAPIIGNVCMDMCMVNLEGIAAQEGDEAIVFGPEVSLSDLAKGIGTIPYELLTNISTRVKRVYYLD
ncbi:bifunctional UDP-N-acetylmuramoyl-tripeptide:D-alanyl-D-alanine ligase/alanine racemase [Algoriphagus namhaensis]|uniref:Alanine racemase n=1 Tax=Algoriphagus namhaensis TaxID=915353 RepID=A0ABV8AQW9_9BACT